ncbi:hypothetical protein J6590_103574 [Homalodisca vitripennis]|nr:hypothetical protein J6590_103574 [Homalodisca vitripennis]
MTRVKIVTISGRGGCGQHIVRISPSLLSQARTVLSAVELLTYCLTYSIGPYPYLTHPEYPVTTEAALGILQD